MFNKKLWNRLYCRTAKRKAYAKKWWKKNRGRYNRLHPWPKQPPKLAIKHGEAGKTTEYTSWSQMKSRCYNHNNHKYFNYGGRGVSVCNRWKDSYINFIKDMGRKPGKEYTLDRINNDGNYKPSNCRWADPVTQANNRRRNKK